MLVNFAYVCTFRTHDRSLLDMPKRDTIDDLTDLLYPLPDRSHMRLVDSAGYTDDDPDAEAEAFDVVYGKVAQQRHAFEDNLRTVQEASPIVLDSGTVPVDVDPLITELHRARVDQQDAERRLRLLLAYAREYTPNDYSLAELGGAAGMSGSGVRTFYTAIDVGRVFELLNRRMPAHIVGLRAAAGPHECAIIAGKRNHRVLYCPGAPAVIGGAPHTEQLFSVCSPHAYLVTNPHTITAPAGQLDTP